MERKLVAGDRVRFKNDTLDRSVHGFGGTVEAVVEQGGGAVAEVRAEGGRLLLFNETQARMLLELVEPLPRFVACWRCGGTSPVGQSCGCFDNGGE